MREGREEVKRSRSRSRVAVGTADRPDLRGRLTVGAAGLWGEVGVGSGRKETATQAQTDADVGRVRWRRRWKMETKDCRLSSGSDE